MHLRRFNFDDIDGQTLLCWSDGLSEKNVKWVQIQYTQIFTNYEENSYLIEDQWYKWGDVYEHA